MNSAPPQGSEIKVDTLNGHQHILVPYGKGGAIRYFIGIFLLFWMGGWFMGFTSAFSQISSGEGGAFLIFWLGGWSVGGLFAGYMIYRAFQKSIPEQLLLNHPSLSLDTGVPPLKIDFGMRGQNEYWKSMFPKRKRIEFSASEIKTMELRETDSGNRLTIDKGAERVEIAIGATEVEREWLFDFLQRNYS